PGMELLSARGLSKYFPETATLANDAVSLGLAEGEIKAVVGENGAGKSTFARILAGFLAPDSGELWVGGARLRPGSVREAEAAGIGYVPQQSLLADGLTVAENLSLGGEQRRLGFLYDRRRAVVEAAALVERYGFHLDPAARASELSPPERRQAEIARALARGGRILVLDEPTSILAESEAEALFALLRRLADSGKGVIFITHRVGEVLGFADSIAVLREGRVVAELAAGAVGEAGLSRLMSRSGAAGLTTGAGRRSPSTLESCAEAPRRVALELSGLVLARGSRPLSLSVRAGEVLGVAALVGNGLGRLEDYLSGLKPAPWGAVRLGGTDLHDIPRHRLRTELLAYVPSDREARGIAETASLGDNVLVLRRREFGIVDFAMKARLRESARSMAASFSLSAEPSVAAGSLSGGNRQRLVLARELDRPRRLAVLAEPFQNLDLGSQEAAAGRIAELAAAGSAVVVLSSSLDELFPIADRIAILYRGSLVHLGPNGGPGSAHALLALMTGSAPARTPV
ncbi:MAG TPA: ATP-binding cassette domain-containing protein, partial [Rectinemataceae bacterium]|nr:ATP-binding cassette domain-containing protein [Rectinemataceae bacterium]